MVPVHPGLSHGRGRRRHCREPSGQLRVVSRDADGLGQQARRVLVPALGQFLVGAAAERGDVRVYGRDSLAQRVMGG